MTYKGLLSEFFGGSVMLLHALILNIICCLLNVFKFLKGHIISTDGVIDQV